MQYLLSYGNIYVGTSFRLSKCIYSCNKEAAISKKILFIRMLLVGFSVIL